MDFWGGGGAGGAGGGDAGVGAAIDGFSTDFSAGEGVGGGDRGVEAADSCCFSKAMACMARAR